LSAMTIPGPGSTISHYRIVETLGHGGQATAFKAEDLRLCRPVVIKALRPELAASEAARRRFEREATLCSALDNPHIQAVYDVGESDGLYYIVLQYVEGPTLKQFMAGRPLETLFALSIAIQLADALAVAHATGIVHRDLKPANIMVGPFGEVTVMDWGIAKRVKNADGTPAVARGTESSGPTDGAAVNEVLKTRQGALVGTPLYMSPEQARGEHDKLDFRSDLYSIAVIFHELVTLQHYLSGRRSLKEVIDGVQTVLPAFPSIAPKAGAEAAPCELAWFFDRGMAKDPALRFQTADEMIEKLQALLDGKFAVQCTRTAMKRGLWAGLQGIDKYPAAWMIGGPAVAAFVAGSTVWAMVSLVRWIAG
jgi:eukaryotic-like serine/threonine-protein kinase